MRKCVNLRRSRQTHPMNVEEFLIVIEMSWSSSPSNFNFKEEVTKILQLHSGRGNCHIDSIRDLWTTTSPK